MNIFSTLKEDLFLKEHWEKKHLVANKIIARPNDLLKVKDLLEMATNEYFESRLVGVDNKNKITIKHGPIELESEIKNLKEWTLVNHNVNLYSKELQEIQKELEFVPAWLFDDVMATYSNEGSSIGAHIDNYNVFIIQLQGRRKWELEYDPNPSYQEDLEVKILKEFNPQFEFILNPGDMIYIPPHVAHQGTSLEESLSLSFGFKSMEDKALVEQFAIELVNNFNSEDFYKTSFNQSVIDPTLISETVLNDIKERMIKNVFTDEFIENTVLKFTSATKKPTQELDEANQDAFLSRAKKQPLYKDEYTRISAIKKAAYYKVSINDFDVQANEQEYLFIKSLNDMTCEDELLLSDFSIHEQIIFRLYQKGILFFNDES